MKTIHNTKHHATRLALSVIQSGITPAIDLDGVLLDARARQLTKADGSLCLEHYRENSTPEKIAQDKTLPLIDFVNALNNAGVGYHVITARVACTSTRKLLKDKGINPLSIMARRDENDHRRDYKLKCDHLAANFTQRQRENMVLIDDNLANCKAVQELGLKAVRVEFDGH